jgi:hypothetical protein
MTRKTSKKNRIALLINTQYHYKGQQGTYIGEIANTSLIRQAWRISNTISEDQSGPIDRAFEGGAYQLTNRGTTLTSSTLMIEMDKGQRKYLKTLKQLNAVLEIGFNEKLSEYLNED